MDIKDFCNIRTLCDRQVVAYMKDDDKGWHLTIMFKYDGAHAEMAMKFTTETKMKKAFANFVNGGMDNLIIGKIEEF